MHTSAAFFISYTPIIESNASSQNNYRTNDEGENQKKGHLPFVHHVLYEPSSYKYIERNYFP